MNRSQIMLEFLERINTSYELVYMETFDSEHVCEVKIQNNNFVFELFKTNDTLIARNLYKDIKQLYIEMPEETRTLLIEEIFVKIKGLQVERLKNEVQLLLNANVRKRDIFSIGFTCPESALDEDEILTIVAEVLENHEKNNN